MGRVAFLILKWLLIPAALAAAGYYFVGPRIGKIDTPSLPKTAPPPEDTAVTQSTKENDKTYPAPDIDVKVGAVSHKEPRKRVHRKKPKPKADDTVKVTPPTDNGTTGGGDTGGGADPPPPDPDHTGVG